MFKADHVVQSVTSPYPRKLVFIDDQTGATKEVPLGRIGSWQLAEFDGQYYDCWGRPVRFDGRCGIKHIVRTTKDNVSLVELKNNRLAFAKLNYRREPYRNIDIHGLSASNAALEKGDDILAELTTFGNDIHQYTAIDFGYFRGTAIGKVFEKHGLEVALAQITDVDGPDFFRFVSDPHNECMRWDIVGESDSELVNLKDPGDYKTVNYSLGVEKWYTYFSNPQLTSDGVFQASMDVARYIGFYVGPGGGLGYGSRERRILYLTLMAEDLARAFEECEGSPKYVTLPFRVTANASDGPIRPCH